MSSAALRSGLPLTLLKWVGTAAQIAGAAAMASNAVSPVLAYGGMGAGSLAWIVAGLLMKEPSLVALNAAFTAINLVGILRWS